MGRGLEVGSGHIGAGAAGFPGGFFSGFFFRFPFFDGFVMEVGDPDADFVEENHGHGQKRQVDQVGCGCEQGRDDHDDHDGVAARVFHQLVAKNPQLVQRVDDHRELKAQSENQGELDHKTRVIRKAVFSRTAERQVIVVEESQSVGRDHGVGKKHPS